MRGVGNRSIVGENITAATPSIDVERTMNLRWKLCWKCQQNKSPVGGHIKLLPGLMKFICKDCMDKKKEGSK